MRTGTRPSFKPCPIFVPVPNLFFSLPQAGPDHATNRTSTNTKLIYQESSPSHPTPLSTVTKRPAAPRPPAHHPLRPKSSTRRHNALPVGEGHRGPQGRSASRPPTEIRGALGLGTGRSASRAQTEVRGALGTGRSASRPQTEVRGARAEGNPPAQLHLRVPGLLLRCGGGVSGRPLPDLLRPHFLRWHAARPPQPRCRPSSATHPKKPQGGLEASKRHCNFSGDGQKASMVSFGGQGSG
ncbi:hypothetical protein QBC39DRAFT_366389 [Podospora conica]|nr:hypothetical protein QBC39DRAFT_366389 [Schizothecium conicum]